METTHKSKYADVIMSIAKQLSGEDVRSMSMYLVNRGNFNQTDESEINGVSQQLLSKMTSLSLLSYRNINLLEEILKKHKLQHCVNELDNYRKEFLHQDFEEEAYIAVARLVKSLSTWYHSLTTRLAIGPWIDQFDLDDFFVNFDIEKMSSFSRNMLLNSYQDIINLSGNRTLILGDAGIGKTILCLKLIKDWIEGKKNLTEIKLVMFLRLRHVSRDQRSVVGAFLSSIPDIEPISVGAVENFIISNKDSVHIFFDGLDELPQNVEGTEIEQEILTIIRGQKFNGVKVYLSSRDSSVSKLGTTCRNCFDNIVKIKGFSREAAESFITDKMLSKNSKAATELIESFERNGMFDHAGTHPMVLTICSGSVRVNVERGDTFIIPQTFSGYFMNFKGCFDYHFTKKIEESKHFNEETITKMVSQIPQIMVVIGKIAWDGLKQDKLYWECKELRNLCPANSFELAITYGIIRVDSKLVLPSKHGYISVGDLNQASDIAMFPHKLYQEFTAAHYIASTDSQSIQDILQEMDDWKLEYPLRFASGINPNIAAYIIKVLTQNDKHGLNMIAVQCLREYCYGDGKKDGSNKTVLKDAIQSITAIHIRKTTEEPAVMSLLQYACNEQVSLRLHMVCKFRSPSFIHNVLTTSADLIQQLYIDSTGVSCFHSLSADSSPPQAKQLTKITINMCDLNEVDGITSSDVFESVIMYALQHAPQIEKISWLNCIDLPDEISRSNTALRERFSYNKTMKVLRLNIYDELIFLSRQLFTWGNYCEYDKECEQLGIRLYDSSQSEESDDSYTDESFGDSKTGKSKGNYCEYDKECEQLGIRHFDSSQSEDNYTDESLGDSKTGKSKIRLYDSSYIEESDNYSDRCVSDSEKSESEADNTSSGTSDRQEYQTPKKLHVTRTVTSTGNTLEIEGSGINLKIPEDAVPPGKEYEISMEVLNTSEVNLPTEIKYGLSTPVIRLYPHGMKFLKNVTMSLPHSLAVIHPEKVPVDVYMSKGTEGGVKWTKLSGEEGEVRLEKTKLFISFQHFCEVCANPDPSGDIPKKLLLYGVGKKLSSVPALLPLKVEYCEDRPDVLNSRDCERNKHREKKLSGENTFLLDRKESNPIRVISTLIDPDNYKMKKDIKIFHHKQLLHGTPWQYIDFLVSTNKSDIFPKCQFSVTQQPADKDVSGDFMNISLLFYLEELKSKSRSNKDKKSKRKRSSQPTELKSKSRLNKDNKSKRKRSSQPTVEESKKKKVPTATLR